MRKSDVGSVLMSLILVASCDGAPEQQTTPAAGIAFAVMPGAPDSLESSAAALASDATTCGEPGQDCCAHHGNYTCRTGSCRINRRFFPPLTRCPLCGGSGQTCCTGNTCNSGLICSNGVCSCFHLCPR